MPHITRHLAEVVREELGVDGGGHGHHPEVRPLAQHVTQDDQQEVRVQVALVHLQGDRGGGRERPNLSSRAIRSQVVVLSRYDLPINSCNTCFCFLWLPLARADRTIALNIHTIALNIHTFALNIHTIALNIHTVALNIHTVALTSSTMT
eukprot:1180115-Prorocentrum_minimum.AAC.2